MKLQPAKSIEVTWGEDAKYDRLFFVIKGYSTLFRPGDLVEMDGETEPFVIYECHYQAPNRYETDRRGRWDVSARRER